MKPPATGRRPTHVVATLGSAGDLHPFLAVARALAEQGHAVLFLGGELHREEVQAQGVPFEAVVDAATMTRCAQHPGLWHPLGGFGVLWRHLAVPAIGPTVAALQRLAPPAGEPPLQVLASPLVAGARLVLESLNLRLTTAHTAPAGLRSARHPFFLQGHAVPAWAPDALRRLAWRWLDHHKLEPMAGARLDGWRRQLGLPPLPRPLFATGLMSPRQVLGLFPADFAPPGQSLPDDWPMPVACLGFPLYEAGGAPDPALQAWWEAPGGPRLVCYPGSAATAAPAVYAAAAHRLAQGEGGVTWRVLHLGPGPSRPLAPTERQTASAPLAWLLPQAQAFLHHGGIGACAQGLAAGVPQWAWPQAYDQFDNAWRLQGLQAPLGLPRWPRRPTVTQVVASCLRAAAAPRAPVRGGWSLPGRPNAAVQAVLHRLHAGRALPG
ncbi:nucleotide disphospho-sugar-binding domain-containing protein [Ideonella livida]|uniref:Glycosyltransferase family 1 protein n=1 Tax=Ideonella livida TaxID=2707176 RepID=A0A7C9TM23_9BURK|nr:nucleotide disphospho-sugar-binding domain-containing protein [Ideonella livida]NDY92663.1 glycosyltransferase family 1 protein [Ideonella livida]